MPNERFWKMPDKRIRKALEIAAADGQTDGDHHKAWVIDQMVRALLGDGYHAWVKCYEHPANSDDEYSWETGIAP